MPAHDWLNTYFTQFPEPANLINNTEGRNTAKGTGFVIGKNKGISWFNPSQPCPGSVQIAPQYAIVTGNSFAFFLSANAIQHDKMCTTDKPDIVGLNWDRQTGGENYSYADGHAKYQKQNQVLNPNKYQFGDYFYPGLDSFNPTASTH